MLYFTWFTPEVPPLNTTGTPPPWGGLYDLSGKQTPVYAQEGPIPGEAYPPREVLREPPPRGGADGGGVKSRKTLGISAKTYRDSPLLAMFSWFLIPFSGYPTHLPDPGVLGGGKGSLPCQKCTFTRIELKGPL